MKCDGTRAETRFGLSAKRTSPFKSTGASVQSTAGSRGVRISGINAGYTMFRGSVKRCEGDLLPTSFASLPFTSPPVRHHVPSRFNLTLILNHFPRQIVVRPTRLNVRLYAHFLSCLLLLAISKPFRAVLTMGSIEAKLI